MTGDARLPVGSEIPDVSTNQHWRYKLGLSQLSQHHFDHNRMAKVLNIKNSKNR